MRILEQTHEEKISMYMKMKKREIAEMLVNANEVIDNFQKRPLLQEITSITIPTDTNVLFRNGEPSYNV